MSKKLSRDELLDEAIVKAKEAEDWQLAEWLRAARGSDDACRWFTTKINDLKTENEQLRKLLVSAFENMDAWQRVIADSDQWGYGKGCLDRLCELRDAMRELGMKVDV